LIALSPSALAEVTRTPNVDRITVVGADPPFIVSSVSPSPVESWSLPSRRRTKLARR
jgi:hypothetical protein